MPLVALTSYSRGNLLRSVPMRVRQVIVAVMAARVLPHSPSHLARPAVGTVLFLFPDQQVQGFPDMIGHVHRLDGVDSRGLNFGSGHGDPQMIPAMVIAVIAPIQIAKRINVNFCSEVMAPPARRFYQEFYLLFLPLKENF